jgi:inner membrane protein
LDVLAFRFGISYGSEWGHRGWTHSVVFSILFGGLMALIFRQLNRNNEHRNQSETLIPTAFWLILSTLSHPLLDMLTNGGRGCALWWPFSTERIFFPIRPIQVSPMSIGGFISEWGLEVLASEFVWIGLPSLGLVLLAKLFRFKIL